MNKRKTVLTTQIKEALVLTRGAKRVVQSILQSGRSHTVNVEVWQEFANTLQAIENRLQP